MKMRRWILIMAFTVIFISMGLLGVAYAGYTQNNRIINTISTSTMDYVFGDGIDGSSFAIKLIDITSNETVEEFTAHITPESKTLFIEGEFSLNKIVEGETALLLEYTIRPRYGTMMVPTYSAMENIDVPLILKKWKKAGDSNWIDYSEGDTKYQEITNILKLSVGNFVVQNTCMGRNGSLLIKRVNNYNNFSSNSDTDLEIDSNILSEDTLNLLQLNIEKDTALETGYNVPEEETEQPLEPEQMENELVDNSQESMEEAVEESMDIDRLEANNLEQQDDSLEETSAQNMEGPTLGDTNMNGRSKSSVQVQLEAKFEIQLKLLLEQFNAAK